MARSLLRSALLASALLAGPACAQGMPPEQIKQIVEMTRANWVSFRDWDGRLLIYFTHLEAWKCGIDVVFYGFDDGPLDRMWELEACDPAAPNAVTRDMPYLSLPAGSVRSIKVQLIYKDGTKSSPETFVYNPATAR